MADFKELYEEKVRLEQRIKKANKLITESEARLAVVNKEVEEENNKRSAGSVERQEWFDQKWP